MFTTATLTIDSFSTGLRLATPDWRPGEPRERINVLGEGDWDTDYVAYFRAAADRLLAERGYTRIGDWRYEADPDVHAAPIAAN